MRPRAAAGLSRLPRRGRGGTERGGPIGGGPLTRRQRPATGAPVRHRLQRAVRGGRHLHRPLRGPAVPHPGGAPGGGHRGDRAGHREHRGIRTDPRPIPDRSRPRGPADRALGARAGARRVRRHRLDAVHRPGPRGDPDHGRVERLDGGRHPAAGGLLGRPGDPIPGGGHRLSTAAPIGRGPAAPPPGSAGGQRAPDRADRRPDLPERLRAARVALHLRALCALRRRRRHVWLALLLQREPIHQRGNGSAEQRTDPVHVPVGEGAR